MTRPTGRRRRNGSMLPLLAVSVISLFAFVALAVDLGMLAVSRTQCQNAADAAALTGCRTLNNKTGVANSNLAQAVAIAKTTTTDNVHLSAQFTTAQIQKIETGQYLYDATAQRFRVVIEHRLAHAMRQEPRGSVGAEAKHAHQLMRGHALLARRHQVEGERPFVQRHMA